MAICFKGHALLRHGRPQVDPRPRLALFSAIQQSYPERLAK